MGSPLSHIYAIIYDRMFRRFPRPVNHKHNNSIKSLLSKCQCQSSNKNGTKRKAENYCPISLTCVCCKVMEHVITSNIMAYMYLDKCQLLHTNQHGFRKKLSCETQLIKYRQDISDTFYGSGQTDNIVMYFSKAFDTVDHERLLLKLQSFGIKNDVISWIRSFLSNRTQQVVLEGEESDTCPVMSGVGTLSVSFVYK